MGSIRSSRSSPAWKTRAGSFGTGSRGRRPEPSARRRTTVYGRDEILWFSADSAPEAVTFNVPFTEKKPKKASAKYEFKKVSNVWDDIELVHRPERSCRRPLPLLGRLIKTHSNAGDLVVDFFTGYGTTGIVAHNLGRRFLGCEQVEKDAEEADRRVTAAKQRAIA